MIEKASAPERLVLTFKEFYEQVYGCSRARAIQYVQSGELETFVDRGRRKVLVEKAREFVARKAAAGGAVPPKVRAQKRAAGKLGRAIQTAANKAAA